MKKHIQVIGGTLLLACVVIMLSACGGGNATSINDVSSTPTSIAKGSASRTAQPPISIVTASPGGNGKQVEVVRVIKGEMYFKPSRTTFEVGQPYQFFLTNEGKQPHEFTIASPRKAGQTEKDEEAKALIDSADLMPGQTRTVNFTFKQPAPAGTLEIECSYPGHYEMGMHVAIVVKA